MSSLTSLTLQSAVQAEVYTPELIQPYTPTQELATALNGSGAAQAQVTITIDDDAGQIVTFTSVSDALGNFATDDLTLTRDNNLLTVRFSDTDGNISKPASVRVVSAAAPAAPTDLTAILPDASHVELAWAVNPEPDLIGYRPFRNGAALLTDITAIWFDRQCLQCMGFCLFRRASRR